MKGVYCLLINIARDINVKIGALGNMNFEKGGYAYTGSAQNNIEKRVARHLSKDKKLKWHIDYLLNNKNVKISKVLYKETGRKEEECETARELMKHSKIIKGFGCSDCSCSSHLMASAKFKRIKDFKELK